LPRSAERTAGGRGFEQRRVNSDFAPDLALNYEERMIGMPNRLLLRIIPGGSGSAPRKQVNDYDALRDYLKQHRLPEFVLSFEEIEEIIDAALPRAAQRASWWETLRSPQEKMPQREACLAGGYIATRLADGKRVRFKRMPHRRPRASGEP
jgi:hypothetical protein